ncbi:MAG: coproporphyrinogen III oxidase family protein [Pseudomonadota bacterium]
MYIFESILNRFYRTITRSVLKFDEPTAYPVPPKAQTDTDDYLLYIHIPFCEALCPYCSFHRQVYDEGLARTYFAALTQELHMYKKLGYDFKAMYIGGGTPTILMDRLIDTIAFTKNNFAVAEISVETNPNHMTEHNLTLLKHAGVNRLSVGVQSFDDVILKNIGRYEKYGSGEEIIEKLKNAAALFDTLNVDLIFNMPIQTEESLKRDLDRIEELLPDQVTFYPLMTAPSVEAVLKKSLGPISYKKEKQFYFMILNRMKKNYTGSTAWCFSRKKSMIDEYIVAYDKYAGAGSGAFGYFNDCIYINTFSLDEYVSKVNKGELPVTRVKRFSDRENLYYFILMKLFGLSLDKKAFEKAFSKSYGSSIWFETLILKLSGAIQESDTAVTLTDRGRYYWVMAMREFFIAVDTMRDYCKNMVKK